MVEVVTQVNSIVVLLLVVSERRCLRTIFAHCRCVFESKTAPSITEPPFPEGKIEVEGRIGPTTTFPFRPIFATLFVLLCMSSSSISLMRNGHHQWSGCVTVVIDRLGGLFWIMQREQRANTCRSRRAVSAVGCSVRRRISNFEFRMLFVVCECSNVFQ